MSDTANSLSKEVIYIDIDDEITGIISKVRGSDKKIVALVLPKRASVLQSVVNMKLLKRGADEAKKNLVLITSEAGLMPLAGAVGIHVAKSLQSKPEIPDTPLGNSAAGAEEDEAISDIAAEDAVDKTKPVGELAGAAAADDAIKLDNSPGGAAAKGAAKDKGGKKSKIPNFNRFRLLIILGSVGLVALIIFVFLAVAVLPKANITIKTDSEAVTSSTVLGLKTTSGVQLDVGSGIVPAHSQQTQKTASQQAAATGQQNNGAKATGTVTIKNCTDGAPAVTIPGGTGVVSGGLTYITAKTITVDSANFNGGVCKPNGSHIVSVDVTAQQAGAKYNLSANSNYTVAGFSGLTASGGDMTGGTDDIVKVIAQSDIDSATQKISSQDTSNIKQELKTGLTNAGYFPIDATFSANTPQTKTSANSGDKADSVTVTQTTTYSMLGAKQDDLKKIVKNDVSRTIDTGKQSITDYGLNAAVFGLQSQPSDGADVTMQTTVIAGPDLNTEQIKQQVAGKKAGAAKEIIRQNPGVTDVDVGYSPFWVSSIPKKTSKIKVTIQKPQKTTQASSSSNASSN